MTTANTRTSGKTKLRFPDPPERTPDDMTSVKAIHINGQSHSLKMHFADRPNTIVDAEHYISPVHTQDMTGITYPDLLVAFDADPDALERSNAYVIAEQGKPPEFVLEVASRSTRTTDRTTKRDTYAKLEIPEYWRFDENPTRNNPGLAGDQLVDGKYQPIDIEEFADGILQGYSAALNLLIRWDHGHLGWHDPATGLHIPTFQQEREGRLQAETRANTAETRIRELEEELNRRNTQG